MHFEEYLKALERRLYRSFDLERNFRVEDYTFDLFAQYHLRNERYVLSKKVTIYAIESNEYCFIHYFKDLNHNALEDFINALKKSIDYIVKPCEDHMSSVITGVIVVDHAPSKEWIETIKKFKYHKGFAFGFKGWTDIRLLLVTLNEEFVIANKKGREVEDVYNIKDEHERSLNS